jgi:hypothetical protein
LDVARLGGGDRQWLLAHPGDRRGERGQCHHAEQALVNAVAFLTAVATGTKLKLAILATYPITAAKRLFGVPDFRLHAIADGIREAGARSPRRAIPASEPDPQPSLGFT